jgi:peptidoglycan hydrolase-like protein with peptidoglycan-binding domain
VGKKKKAVVAADAPRSSRPIAGVLSTATVVGCCAILFNAFFNQPESRDKPSGDETASLTGISQKTSRTVTIKYSGLVEDIQRELATTGHFKGNVDGVTGPQTRLAIEAYQRDNRLELTGEANKTLLEHILYTKKLDQAAKFTGSLQPQNVAPEKQSDVKPLAALPKVKKPTVASVASTSSGDKAILKVQERLAGLGYDPGSRSGQLDEGTRSAILIFEMDKGLPMQGKISKSLLVAIKDAEGKTKKN